MTRVLFPSCALFLALLALTASCGSGGGIPDDPRVSAVASYITAVTDRYALGGADAMYPFLEEHIKQNCTREAFVQGVSREPRPTAYRALKAVSFQDDDRYPGGTAEAKVDFITQQGDIERTWKVAQMADSTWRLVKIPGMDACPA